VIREAKILYYEYVIDTSENKVKITWNTINNVTGKTASLI
jgi:hypothetical protein